MTAFGAVFLQCEFQPGGGELVTQAGESLHELSAFTFQRRNYQYPAPAAAFIHLSPKNLDEGERAMFYGDGDDGSLLPGFGADQSRTRHVLPKHPFWAG